MRKPIAHQFRNRDILSIKDLSREEIECVFKIAKKMESIPRRRTKSSLLREKILGTLFFQPSTRTRLSFESAMQRLGGSVLGFADPGLSRAGDVYGETLDDTARMVQLYADVVAMRHFEGGAPRRFAESCDIPVLNAGDGYGDQAEHPTQALLDLYTIQRGKGSIDDLNVVLWGDMNQRTMQSLAYGLAKFRGVKLFSYCPDDLRFPKKTEGYLDDQDLDYEYSSTFEDVVRNADVVYVIGPKRSRAELPTEDRFRLTAQRLKNAKRSLMVLHPLPRLDEVASDVDETRHARYFDQPFYGIAIRMSLLALVLGRAESLAN